MPIFNLPIAEAQPPGMSDLRGVYASVSSVRVPCCLLFYDVIRLCRNPAATVLNQAISSVPSQKRLRSLPTAAHSQYRAAGHKCPAVPGRKRPALTAPLRGGLVRTKLSGSWLMSGRARDVIGEIYLSGPASPGIGDSAMFPCLTPEYRLLCPSGMNDWRRTARQSKTHTSI